jgi:hypothetical protein
MLLHCLYLFEFKFVFEFNSCELLWKYLKGFLFPFLLFRFWPKSPAQPSLFPRPSSPFQSCGPSQPTRLPPPCTADRWGRVVIPILGSASSRARVAPWLCAGRVPAPSPFLGPARPGCPLGLLSHRHRATLGFLPLTAAPRRRSTFKP